MKIMCDTNVIIDVLLEREPFIEESYKVLKRCEEHKIDGFVSASSVTDIYYLVRKYTHSTDLAYKAVGKLLEIAKVCSVTNNDILIAFQKRQRISRIVLLQHAPNLYIVIILSPETKKILKALVFLCLLQQKFFRKSYNTYFAEVFPSFSCRLGLWLT